MKTSMNTTAVRKHLIRFVALPALSLATVASLVATPAHAAPPAGCAPAPSDPGHLICTGPAGGQQQQQQGAGGQQQQQGNGGQQQQQQGGKGGQQQQQQQGGKGGQQQQQQGNGGQQQQQQGNGGQQQQQQGKGGQQQQQGGCGQQQQQQGGKGGQQQQQQQGCGGGQQQQGNGGQQQQQQQQQQQVVIVNNQSSAVAETGPINVTVQAPATAPADPQVVVQTVNVPTEVGISIDRGLGGQYAAGDLIGIAFVVSQPMDVEVAIVTPNDRLQLFAGHADGPSNFTTVVPNLPGILVLEINGTAADGTSAKDTTWFVVG